MAADSAPAAGSVLVTRPAGEASDLLCNAVVAAGYTVHSQPLLELEAVVDLDAAQRQHLLDFDVYQHGIFISANAVRHGMAQLENYWPQLPVGLQWYAIGSATAKLLERYGVSAITPGRVMSSEGLLAVPQLQSVEGERVIIIKGEGGRDTLSEALLQRGARVDELACYRRRSPQLPVGELARRLTGWKVATAMISSGEGLANFQMLLSPSETTKFKQLCLIVPSGRVARLAKEAGFERVVTAENASDAAMVRALATSTSSGE